MPSLNFPSLFSQPKGCPNGIPHATTSRPFSATAAAACFVAAGAAAFAGISVAQNSKTFLPGGLNWVLPSDSSTLPWCSVSLADSSGSVVHSKTGESFPAVIFGSQRLLGIGLRRKSILGLKNIDVYAYGVYADDDEVKKSLGDKYGKFSASELKVNKEFKEDLMEADVTMTVRLQIIYGKLSIGSVRSAFEDSVGSRLQKFGGPDNKDLLQSFTSLFKDEYKIPRGSVIILSKEQGHVLRTIIDGKEVGCIQSKVLCKSILDLYIGEDPFDRQAKEDIETKIASLVPR